MSMYSVAASAACATRIRADARFPSVREKWRMENGAAVRAFATEALEPLDFAQGRLLERTDTDSPPRDIEHKEHKERHRSTHKTHKTHKTRLHHLITSSPHHDRHLTPKPLLRLLPGHRRGRDRADAGDVERLDRRLDGVRQSDPAEGHRALGA